MFVCPRCQATRTQHQRCCGLWPIAVDLADTSWRATIASLSIEALSSLCFGSAEEKAERDGGGDGSPDASPLPGRFARHPGVRSPGQRPSHRARP